MDILSIITALTSIIAIIISVITLRQNSKMMEESTRGYLVAYGDIANFGSPIYYLVLKNYGSSAATVREITFDGNVEKYSFKNKIPFEKVKNVTVAPNQSIITTLYTFSVDLTPFTVNIKYISNGKTYNESFYVDPKSLSSNVIPKTDTKGKELRTISYAIQELTQKKL